ncbi:hypothetical protein Tco_0507437 [Tanacetum coccineum]
MKKIDSDILYAVSIKEDTVYLCLHFDEDHEGTRSNTPYPENSICRIQDIEGEYSGRYQTWSLLQEIPNTSHDENTNLIKELRASTDFALRNQKASIKALEIQVRQMSIILHERLSRNLQSSIEINPRVHDEMISTSVKADKPSIRRINASQYVVSNLQNRNLFSESKKTTLPSLSHLNDDYWDELKEANGEKDLEAYYTDAKPLGKTLPQKEKDPGSFTLPLKRPKGIVENVLVGICFGGCRVTLEDIFRCHPLLLDIVLSFMTVLYTKSGLPGDFSYGLSWWYRVLSCKRCVGVYFTLGVWHDVGGGVSHKSGRVPGGWGVTVE